jgi:hypothetical protein
VFEKKVLRIYLFNDAASKTFASNDRINELERMWKEAVVAQFKAYPGICMVGLRETCMRWTRNVARIRGLRYAYKILAG